MIYLNDKCLNTPNKLKDCKTNYLQACWIRKITKHHRKKPNKNWLAKCLFYNKNYRLCKQRLLNRKSHNLCLIITAINTVRPKIKLCKTSNTQKKFLLELGQIFKPRQISVNCFPSNMNK
jgi:hypothetical protein